MAGRSVASEFAGRTCPGARFVPKSTSSKAMQQRDVLASACSDGGSELVPTGVTDWPRDRLAEFSKEIEKSTPQPATDFWGLPSHGVE